MHLGSKILQIFLQVIALQSLEGTGIHLHCFGMEDHLNGHKVRKNFCVSGPCYVLCSVQAPTVKEASSGRTLGVGAGAPQF